MERVKKMTVLEFHSKFKRTGGHREAIFTGRKALMEELYATGAPIYCNQSYYANDPDVNLVEKVGEHFHCDGYKHFEEWRDCHYYSEYEDADGNKAWLMTGGRYD
mgnify:CR=1 FL=1